MIVVEFNGAFYAEHILLLDSPKKDNASDRWIVMVTLLDGMEISRFFATKEAADEAYMSILADMFSTNKGLDDLANGQRS